MSGIPTEVPRLQRAEFPGRANILSACAAGAGSVHVTSVRGRSEVTRLSASSPLRLLCPRGREIGDAAWVIAGTYGGGLVTGDSVSITMDCGPETKTLLGTQASTKVYRRGTAEAVCSQALHAIVREHAVLVSLPDPTTCFAGSRLVQRQHFELEPGASLVVTDWTTSGRMARGERWAFDRYRSELTVAGDVAPLREVTTLAHDDGSAEMLACAVSGSGEPIDCLGVVWVLGPRFDRISADLISRMARAPIDRRADVLFSVSPLRQNGVGIRFAATTTRAAWQWLHEHFRPALGVLGFDPFSRRG